MTIQLSPSVLAATLTLLCTGAVQAANAVASPPPAPVAPMAARAPAPKISAATATTAPAMEQARAVAAPPGAATAPQLVPARRRSAAIADSKPTLEYLPTQALTIATGSIKVLPIPGKVVRLALGSGNLLSTTTVDSNLLLIAEQAGTTSLLVWTSDKVYSYQVTVVPTDLLAMRAKVDALTKDVKGVTVDQVGSELVLSGLVHRELFQQLSASLKGLQGVVFNVREDQGSAYTRSVLFRLHFIEVKRSLLETIGIDWAKSANGPTFGAMGVAKQTGVYDNLRQVVTGEDLLQPIPPFVKKCCSTGGLFLGLATTLTSRLNLGISDGDVRILASPELTARSGGKARLQVGGEVPIPIAGSLGAQNVEFKPYGIIFSIEPQIDANNVITAKISTELSQIDSAVSVSGVPGFLTRSTATEVSLKAGEVVALSGLVNSEMSTAIDRVPALSRVPILGRLFRSDDFRNSRSELVVLLEPEIIEAGDGLAARLRERGEANKKEFEDKALQLQQKAERLQPVPPPHDHPIPPPLAEAQAQALQQPQAQPLMRD